MFRFSKFYMNTFFVVFLLSGGLIVPSSVMAQAPQTLNGQFIPTSEAMPVIADTSATDSADSIISAQQHFTTSAKTNALSGSSTSANVGTSTAISLSTNPGGSLTPTSPSAFLQASLNVVSANPSLGAITGADLTNVVLNLSNQNLVGMQTASLYVMQAGDANYHFVKTLSTQVGTHQVTVGVGGGLSNSSSYKITLAGEVVTERPIQSPSAIRIISGGVAVHYTYSFTFTTKASSVNAECSTNVNMCIVGTPTNSQHLTTTTTWTCVGLKGGSNASCSLPDTGLAGSKLGINIAPLSDWGNHDNTFVDVVKSSRGFGSSSSPWGFGNTVPVDADGWPTTDFGDVLVDVGSGDPLKRPYNQTYPTMYGTYHISFTGVGTVGTIVCCTVQNQKYDAGTNTTTADIIVSPKDSALTISITKTKGGVKNLKVIRPGYPADTTQVFTNEFLSMVKPFSTLRFMDFTGTNASNVTSWADRTQPNTRTHHAAWEDVIAIANATGKDIWINIPDQVDLTDTSPNNYVTQLAKLLKANLNPNVHVYVEWSNELWNYMFVQATRNLNAAVDEVNSGADKTLAYEGGTNKWYWAIYRTVHQTVRVSELFRAVYGDAMINTTIRPVFATQWVQPYLLEAGLHYLATNFGPPSRYIYAVAGAPYMGVKTNYTDVDSYFVNQTVGLNQVLWQQMGVPTYAGNYPQYSSVSFKNLADYYHLKSVTYEGGPGVFNSDAIVETSLSDLRTEQMVEGQLADFFGCGNDLFMYYSSSTPAGDPWGAYEDLTVPTQKSKGLLKVANTPLSHYKVCSSTYVPQLLGQ